MNTVLCCGTGTRVVGTIVLAMVVALAASASAATINVPGDQPTIQQAINAAAAGDTILVANGTYTENLTVNKPLTILSVNGAPTTIIAGTADNTPVVDITVDGVTIGGQGQGFTIQQQDTGTGLLNSGCAVVDVDGSVVKAGTVTVQYCRLQGNNADVGLYVSAGIAGGHLVIEHNRFDMYPGATNYAFIDAVYFGSTDFGGNVGPASVNTGRVDFRYNTVRDFDVCGIEVSENVFKSVMTIENATFTPDATPTGNTYAIDFEDYVDDLSTVAVRNVIVNSGYEGLYLYGVYSNSTFEVSNCNMSGITGYAIDIYDIEEGSDVLIDGCTLTGVAGSSEGIYVEYVYYGSTLTVTDNTIVGFADEGTAVDYVEEGSYAWVMRNSIADAADSVYFYYLGDGGMTVIDGNTLTGFTDAGVYIDDYVEYGAHLAISDNTLTADAAGSTYGIYFDDYIEYFAYVEIENNTISGFTDSGIYFYEDIEESDVVVHGNTVTGDAAAEGIYFYYYVEYGSNVQVTGNTVSGCDDGIDFDDYIEYGAAVTVADNTVTGFTDDGIDVYDVYDGSRLTIRNNTLTGDGVNAFAGINVDYVEDGSRATITGNTVSGFTDTGIYIYGYVDEGSELSIVDNTITGLGPGSSAYGISHWDYVEYGATIDYSRNVIRGCADGIYCDYDWEYGGAAKVNGNRISDYTGYGIYVYDVYEGFDATIDDNVLVGGLNPIYVDYLEYGSTLSISNNTITDVEALGTGIYCYEAYEGCIATICGNTVTGLADASFGIAVDYLEYGSDVTVCRNDVSGFDTAFSLDDGMWYGCELVITENQFDATGYAMQIGDMYDGNILQITYNNVTGFADDGLLFPEVLAESDIYIEENRFVGNAGVNGIYFDLAVQEGCTVSVTGNCFSGVDTGVRVDTILDTAVLTATDNDFSGTVTGINNENGDAAHIILADLSFWGPAVTAGQVDREPQLAAAPDSDGDGIANCADLCGGTPAGTAVDADGCSCFQLDPDGDDDGDGVLNCDDGCPQDPAKIEPGACGCGTPDTDTDGDGTPDCNDGCPNDPDKIEAGDCGCGVPDIDTDGDGIADCIDGCPNDPLKTAPGACGCGTPDTDTDGDGIADCIEALDRDGDGVPNEFDGCPDDPDKIDPGLCGCGTPDQDSDNDGIIDCWDNCPDDPNPNQDDRDNDGIGDACDPDPFGCGAGLCGMGTLTMMPLMLLGLSGMKRRYHRSRR